MNIKTGDVTTQAVTPATASDAAPSSMDDIAASMLVDRGGDSVAPAKAARRPAQEPPAAAQGDVEEEDDVTVTAPVTEANDQGDDDNGDDPTLEEQDEDPLDDVFAADDDRGAEDEGDEFDTSKLTDELKLSVTVDGEEQEVTLGELKRRYAGEGAIEKRLQQVTETRKVVVEDYEKTRHLTATLLKQFGTVLFARTVDEPDAALRAKDPNKYLLQRDMYDRETQAIKAMQDQMKGIMTELDDTVERQRAEHRKQASAELRRIMPVLADPVKGPKVREALISAAREIGYSDAQIAACDDPLMFKTVALAARELKRMKGVTATKTPITQRNSPVTGKSAKPAAKSASRQQAAAKARAYKTGSTDDIAATMLMPAPKKR